VLGEIRLDLGAPTGQKRPDDDPLPFRRDPRQAVRSRASEHPHDHGLGLIIGVVPRGYALAVLELRCLDEVLIADEAGRVLLGHRVCHQELGDVLLVAEAGHAEVGREVGDELGVAPGFLAPEPVVQVGDLDLESELLAQGDENMKQADRVGPAGDCDENTVPR
jgi:hypothetical protein